MNNSNNNINNNNNYYYYYYYYIIEFKQGMIQSPYALKEEELRHAVDDKCQVSLLIKE